MSLTWCSNPQSWPSRVYLVVRAVSNMRRALSLLLLGGLLLIPIVTGQQDESVGQCGPQRGAHECHCPRMVAHRQEQHEESCDRESHTPKEREECMRRMPEACDILEHPITYGDEVGEDGSPIGKKDEDSCFKYCRLDLCFCNDTRCGPHGEAVTPPKAKKKGR